MFKKIIVSTLFIMCLFSVSLYLMGVRGPIHMSSEFLAFLNSCSRDLENLHIEIPSIPDVPYFEASDGWLVVLNLLISVVNGLSGMINFIITLINVLIKVISFLFIVLNNFINSRDIIVNSFSQ